MTSFSPDDLSLGASPQALRALIESRRAVRRFLPEAVPDAVIRDCLAAHGFDPGLADSGLFIGAETYARNLEQAVEAGVFGVPFYVTGDDARFWGQDRLAFLDAHLAGRA